MKENKDELQKETDLSLLDEVPLLLKTIVVGFCGGCLIGIGWEYSYWICAPIVVVLLFHILVLSPKLRKELEPDKKFSIASLFTGLIVLLKLVKEFICLIFSCDSFTFVEEKLWDAEEKIESVQLDSEQWKDISNSLQRIKAQLESKDEESSSELSEAKQELEGLEELANTALEHLDQKEKELKEELPELEKAVEEEDRVGEIYLDFLHRIGRVFLWSVVITFIITFFVIFNF